MVDAIKLQQIIEDGLEGYLIPKGYLQQVKAKITPINEQILLAEREHLLDESKVF